MPLPRTITAVILCGVLALTGCSKPVTSDPNGPLKVGASQVPHAEILTFVKDNLAESEGLRMEIVVFNDYIQPNEALKDGSIDANYFQHKPYLDAQTARGGYRFTIVTPVHLEPLGLYSTKSRTVGDLPRGASVAIPNDPSNGGRALTLLQDAGLIRLKDTAGTPATKVDIIDNPRGITIVEMEAAQLPRSLADVDAAVINGNYALAARLDPAKDAIAVESATNNPYANILVSRQDDKDDPRLQKLSRLLCSPETRDFIAAKYAGTVIPACPAR